MLITSKRWIEKWVATPLFEDRFCLILEIWEIVWTEFKLMSGKNIRKEPGRTSLSLSKDNIYTGDILHLNA
jgi:hypothetical protein